MRFGRCGCRHRASTYVLQGFARDTTQCNKVRNMCGPRQIDNNNTLRFLVLQHLLLSPQQVEVSRFDKSSCYARMPPNICSSAAEVRHHLHILGPDGVRVLHRFGAIVAISNHPILHQNCCLKFQASFSIRISSCNQGMHIKVSR